MSESSRIQEIEQDRSIEYSLFPDAEGRMPDPELATSLGRTSSAHESYGALVWRKFRRSKVAIIGGLVVVGLFVLAVFYQFFSPYDPVKLNMREGFIPPTQIHFIDSAGKFHFQPFVYKRKQTLNAIQPP